MSLDVAGRQDWKVRFDLACNAATPAAVLETLAKDGNIVVRSFVALNAATPVAVLEDLATDEFWNVRRGVACNAATPLTLLETLAKDPDEGVAGGARASLAVRGAASAGMSRLAPVEIAAESAAEGAARWPLWLGM